MCNAVFENNVEYIKNQINIGTDINVADYDGRTPLHIAVSLNKANIVKILIDNGANKYIKDRWGCTPIDEALKHNNSLINILNKDDINLLVV